MRRYSPQEAFRIIEAASPKALPDEAGLRRIASEFGIPPEAELPAAAADEPPPTVRLDFWGRGVERDLEFASPLPGIAALHRVAQRTGLPLTSDGRVSGVWQGAPIMLEAVEEARGSTVIMRLPRARKWRLRIACLLVPLLTIPYWIPAFMPLYLVAGREITPVLAWAMVAGGSWWAVGRLESRRLARAAAGVKSILKTPASPLLQPAKVGAE
jgi:hypothetical protein